MARTRSTRRLRRGANSQPSNGAQARHVNAVGGGAIQNPGDGGANEDDGADRAIPDAVEDGDESSRNHSIPYVEASTVTALLDFIVKCWKSTCENPLEFPYAFTTLVQSSGYGKTRVLKELAELVCVQDPENGDSSMRQLYVCLQRGAGSELRDYLFSPWRTHDRAGERMSRSDDLIEALKERIIAIYDVAVSSWDDAEVEWGSLFDGKAKDVANIISQFRQSDSNAIPHQQHRALILAIDEAGWLLHEKAASCVSWFSLFRLANEQIRLVRGTQSGLFALLADTNAKVADFAPPQSANNPARFFPPFVLSHTFDVFHQTELREGRTSRLRSASVRASRRGISWSKFYMDLVTRQQEDESDARWSLLRMGRPLWYSLLLLFEDDQPVDEDHFDKIVSQAALLLIKETKMPEALGARHLYGVASLLCRTGLRPQALSALAARLPADFMATLAYISYERDSQLCAFPCEPVLALAAARLWYHGTVLDSSPLADAILPQLYNLCSPGPTDTGEVGEIVARVILLLIMDATSASNHASKLPTHLFHCVCEFLDYFPRLKNARPCDFERIKKRWVDWKPGFCHFVSLPGVPTKGDLCKLLSQRAAGVLPRNQKGVDLVIPIVRRRQVSMIVVQVKNYERSASITGKIAEKMMPRVAFENSPELSRLNTKDVLGIFMSMRGHSAATTEISTHGGMDLVSIKGSANWPRVVSNAVAEQFQRLLSPWQPGVQMVKEDLKAREEAGDRSFQTDETLHVQADRVLTFALEQHNTIGIRSLQRSVRGRLESQHHDHAPPEVEPGFISQRLGSIGVDQQLPRRGVKRLAVEQTSTRKTARRG